MSSLRTSQWRCLAACLLPPPLALVQTDDGSVVDGASGCMTACAAAAPQVGAVAFDLVGTGPQQPYAQADPTELPAAHPAVSPIVQALVGRLVAWDSRDRPDAVTAAAWAAAAMQGGGDCHCRYSHAVVLPSVLSSQNACCQSERRGAADDSADDGQAGRRSSWRLRGGNRSNSSWR